MSIKKIQKFSKEDIDLYGISFYRLNNQFYVPLILKGNNKTATITITIQAEQISKKDLKDLSSVDEHFHSSVRNIGIKKDAPQDFKNKLIGAIWDFLCTCPVSVYDSPKKLWVYDGWLFEVKHEYEDDEIRLLILEEIDKERQKFERLKRKFDLGLDQRLINTRRERIPEEARIEVWRRDEGKCVKCGSQENLEYDHMIPVSKGGSNTARNIQLLCEGCNRQKGASI